MSAWKPTLDDLLRLHGKLIARTGGSDGVRSLPLIESALQRFDAAFGGQEMYPTLTAKASAVCCGLVQNHGFVDGNKRIGMAALLLILSMNGVTLRYSQPELVALGLAIAQGEMDVQEVDAWIAAHREMT